MTQKDAANQPPPAPSRSALLADARVRTLLDGVTDRAVYLLGPTGIIESWNVGAETITRYRADEVIGKSDSILYPPEDIVAGKSDADLARARSAPGGYDGEAWRVRKGGSRFAARVRIVPVHDEAHTLLGYAVSTWDLVHGKLPEERLRQSEDRFRALVDGVKDYAIFMLDPRGHIITWNSGAEHIKGYRAEEIIGEHFSRFYPEEEARSGKCEYELAVADREGRFEEEGWRVRKDGSLFWANVMITALRDQGQTLVGFAKVTRDLTERRKLELERTRLLQANESIRLRDEFLSIASHELKTPLTTVQLQLQGLRSCLPAGDEKARGRLDRAIRSSGRLAELIETLLDVSHLASGGFVLNCAPVDLTTVVREHLDRFRESAKRAGCQLHFTEAGPIEGSWDRLRIEQVLTNLLSNAIKYGADAPIEVAITREGSDAVLEVDDHGTGIPEGDLPRLFGRFERAASHRHYGGLGLGLFVSRQIVEAHGGAVEARNRVGGGACLRVRLPISRELRVLSGGAAS